jgi:small subunit ribosomal protein S4e
MHQTRSELIKGLPLPRKGTKYVAFAVRNNSKTVPVVVALRDMLKIASTSKEAKHMVHNKMIKINGKIVTDINEPINLFSVIHADKNYKLNVLDTGRFTLEETKDSSRYIKIIGKKAVFQGKMQYNLHDGSNIISKDKMNVGDSVILDFENKVKKHISLEKGKSAVIISGSNVGKVGKINEIYGSNVSLKIDGIKEEVVLHKRHIIIQ